MDNFGVKYIGEEHAQHLLQTVQKYYKCSFEPEGERYCRLTIKWDYPGKKVHILMPIYLENALKQFQHLPRSCHRTNCSHTSKNNMGQKSNMQSHPTTPPHSIRPGRNLSKKSLAYSCSLRERWIQLCSPHSALSHPSRRLPRRTRCKIASNFWTTQHHRNARCKILHDGYQEFLVVHANVLIRIYAIETHGYAGGCHRTLQATQHRNPGRVCIL